MHEFFAPVWASIVSAGRRTAAFPGRAKAQTAQAFSAWRAQPAWDRFTAILFWCLIGLVALLALSMTGLIA